MKQHKDFDCVEMKKQIQEEVAEELAGFSSAEMPLKRRQLIDADPVLGPLVQRLTKAPGGA